MNLQGSFPVAAAHAVASMPLDALRESFSMDQVVLRHLKTADEIATVLDLREEIDLSVHAAAGPHFASVEKKETRSGLSSPSTCMASVSAPSASCRWVTA